jgi:hypothetical protein
VGVSITIWKWRPLWPFRSEARVMERLGRDEPPLALARFDARGFADQIGRRFGEGDDAPFVGIDVCDFTGHRANWITLACGGSASPEVVDELARMCAAAGLHACVE